MDPDPVDLVFEVTTSHMHCPTVLAGTDNSILCPEYRVREFYFLLLLRIVQCKKVDKREILLEFTQSLIMT